MPSRGWWSPSGAFSSQPSPLRGLSCRCPRSRRLIALHFELARRSLGLTIWSTQPAACHRFLTASQWVSVGRCESSADRLANQEPGVGTSPGATLPWPASRRGRHPGSRGRDHESFRALAGRSCGSCRPTPGSQVGSPQGSRPGSVVRTQLPGTRHSRPGPLTTDRQS